MSATYAAFRVSALPLRSLCNPLRGPYKRNEYRKVILPLTIRHRLREVMAMSTPDRGELIVYRTEDGQEEVQLQTLDGSVWLNQGEMAELFDTTKQNISVS